jgi:hypothetical protein
MRAWNKIVVAAVLVMAMASGWAAEQDLAKLYEEGRAAYYRGDLNEAVEKLQVVREAMPDHGATRAMLANALTKIGAQGGGNELEASYAKIVVPRVELVEISVAEALPLLGELGFRASGEKVRPNLLLRPGAGGDARISLTLSEVPLTEAIRYVAQMAGLEVKYEKFAVVIGPRAGAAE